MESGLRTEGGALPGGGGGGGGGDGVLCHACGYQYPNAHPSAKQRRAHRKHCGKPTSAGAAEEGAGECEGTELLTGEVGGGAAAGDGIGTNSEECGGGLPGSAPEAGNAVEGGDNAEHSSGNGTGHQVVEDKCAEDCLTSCSNIPSEVTTEDCRTDNDDIMTALATQDSEKGSPIENGNPAVSSEQLQDVPASVLPPEPEDGARCSEEISGYEIQNSSVVSLASTEGGMSEQTNDVVSELSCIVVTEEDGTITTTGKNKPSEDISVQGKGSLQTKIGEEHCTTVVEEDPSDNTLNVVHDDEIQNDETELNQQSKLMLPNPVEKFQKIEEPVDSLSERYVGTNEDILKVGTGSSHSEASDAVEPQEQLDSTSVTADPVAISTEADNVDGQQYPSTDGGIEAISSVTAPAVGAEVVSVGGATDITENVCSSEGTIGDSIQKNVISGTVMPSQVDLVELSTCTLAHEINMIGSTIDVDEKRQNGKIGADPTSHEINETHTPENLENKEVIAEPISHETDTALSADTCGENEKNEEIIAGASSCKITAVQSTGGIEEKEPIEEFIDNPASEKTNETSSGDIIEEKKRDEVDVESNREIDVACSIETITKNNAASREISAGNATDNVEDKMQNEEITTDPTSHGVSMICSSINEEKIDTEEMTEGLSSHETIVVHGTDDVEEKTYEETIVDPTSHKISMVTSTDSVEERKGEETKAEPTPHEINAVHTADNVEEKKNEEPILDPTSSRIGTVGSTGDVECKKQNEETTADPSSGENNTLQETTADPSSGENNTLQIADDSQNRRQQHEDTTQDPASEKIEVSQNTINVEERERKEDTATKEISTIQCTDNPKGDDQNEEIADKEMVADSDRSHVSLKVLLADKNVETKEKKTSTKDRVLSFRRRASKDCTSPVKPGSPKAGSGQQDWNSPTRLPSEKKPKGRKQQWVPFICCSSTH